MENKATKYLIIPLEEYEDMKQQINQLEKEVEREHERYLQAVEREGNRD